MDDKDKAFIWQTWYHLNKLGVMFEDGKVDVTDPGLRLATPKPDIDLPGWTPADTEKAMALDDAAWLRDWWSTMAEELRELADFIEDAMEDKE